ncbi:MAG: hypothetical protein OXI90_11640 [Gammaproteobacteria bacterium]|nr:hypothetical protein [Gammaproteobacteria bacterium]
MVWKWVRWLLPSPTPRLEDHVSIWSIRANDAGTFFRIVAVLWLVALLRISYNAMERADVPLVGWQIAVDFALAVLGEFGNVGIGTAMLAMLLTRPVNRMGETAMTFYQAMVNRFVIPVIEKHKAEGREEGRAQADSEWTAWNRRRVEAERQGIAFDETPPRR